MFVVAGPNGSGKSTLTSSRWFEAAENLIDPDAIARSMDPRFPVSQAIPAARKAILTCRAMLLNRESFTLETTLAGHGAVTVLRAAQQAGYHTFLAYVALTNPELHINRVRLRVAQGGHDIPDTDIRRRHGRSMARAPEALKLVDEAVVLDNSGSQPVRMLLLKNGRVIWQADVLPEWVRELSLRLAT